MTPFTKRLRTPQPTHSLNSRRYSQSTFATTSPQFKDSMSSETVRQLSNKPRIHMFSHSVAMKRLFNYIYGVLIHKYNSASNANVPVYIQHSNFDHAVAL
eukprot:1185774-Prorocentrum_minimum.AAC.6